MVRACLWHAERLEIVRGIAKMGIALIAPGVTKSTTLFDMIAGTAERIEEIVVRAMT